MSRRQSLSRAQPRGSKPALRVLKEQVLSQWVNRTNRNLKTWLLDNDNPFDEFWTRLKAGSELAEWTVSKHNPLFSGTACS
jgi:hypothetical protein